MKKDIVAVVGYKRPEFLTICQELIVNAEEAEKNHYLFVLGRGFDPQNLKVIESFPFSHDIYVTPAFPYGNTRQSYTVLNALREAANRARKYVYLIEDDIFIGRDYFRWNEAVQEKEPRLFCSIGSCNHRLHKTTDRVDAYYFGGPGDYQSHAVCYNKRIILERVCPHMVKEYWKRPAAYCSSIGGWLGQHFWEQDGLIRRIRKLHPGLKAAFPHVPRAYNAGFYGKNRGDGNQDGYEKKLERVRNVCFDAEKLKKASGGMWKESVPCKLVLPKWEEQVYVEAAPV